MHAAVTSHHQCTLVQVGIHDMTLDGWLVVELYALATSKAMSGWVLIGEGVHHADFIVLPHWKSMPPAA